MRGSFRFLGTGASAGVPVIGCACAVCHSLNPRNRRLRPSGLIQVGDISLLIDVGPDFREQALKANIQRLDAVLLTHTHYDHIAGIDELRALNFWQKKAILCFLSKESFLELEVRYHYLFKPHEEGSSRTAKLEYRILEGNEGHVVYEKIPIRYTSYWQSKMKVNGFRIGNFAYISDIREYDDSIFAFLDGVETLVLSALRAESSKVHFSLEEAAFFAEKIKAKKTWLTHLSHSVDYDIAAHMLPENVKPGVDGLEFFFEV